MKKIAIITVLSFLIIGQAYSQTSKTKQKQTIKTSRYRTTDNYTFKLSDKVTRQKVTFKNRYGITVAGDLYFQKIRGNQKLGCT